MTENWPFAAVYAFFLFGAVARGQTLYWVGRGLAKGVRSRLGDRVEPARLTRARAAIERWGMPVIPLSYLTVGFQTAVTVCAGALEIRWLRYTLWALPGWLVWAAIWGGGGTAAAWAAVTLAARSPWGFAAVAVLLVLAVALVLRARRRRELRDEVERLAEVARHHDDAPGATEAPDDDTAPEATDPGASSDRATEPEG